ncbi:ABC transporter permease [Geotalea toluenoxydans]|uniref:ABC transporter permease n=1 Tax=Geotalea toluenoxydans TaxID=421624 RepID=UPI0006D03ADF|nr:ABC transporter permease [Geotalea toluenoxydans]
MGFFSESLQTAFSLIMSMDREVYTTVWTSIYVSIWSTLFASVIGIPAGITIGIGTFPLKGALTTTLNTLMALPTVVVGLVVYGMISRQGPLGQLGLLFTPKAMVLGQTLLAIPIITNYTLSTIEGADKRILPTALTLGAGPLQGVLQLVREERYGVMAAVIAGFGRVIAEVGAAMMLGGNIRGYTRTMTTAIAMETSKGEFAFGLALGIVLLAVAFLVNLALNILQQQR